MPDMEKRKSNLPADAGKKIISHKNKKISNSVFSIIMEYRETRLYQWINRHPEISIALVGLWGMFIILLFLWFVIFRIAH
jgi:hypothetical protein